LMLVATSAGESDSLVAVVSLQSLCSSYLIFFFQAEDGIRDFHVTGVQTCALPISDGVYVMRMVVDGIEIASASVTVGDEPAKARSEERRVGKECRSGWSRDH